VSPDPGNRDTGETHGVTSATVVRELGQRLGGTNAPPQS
jgi:hypothetical protein